MSLIAIKKKCNLCGHVYSWNPDLGKMNCPRCGSSDAVTVSQMGIPMPKNKK